ncbi:hypothetical protein MTO96_008867 [Rhipicephalus appendiculatus]
MVMISLPIVTGITPRVEDDDGQCMRSLSHYDYVHTILSVNVSTVVYRLNGNKFLMKMHVERHRHGHDLPSHHDWHHAAGRGRRRGDVPER